MKKERSTISMLSAVARALGDHALNSTMSPPLTSRDRRRIKRLIAARTHDWVRTPKRVWKTFNRDERHKWRRWHGPRRNNGRFDWVGNWEYGSDRDVASLHIRAAFAPPLTQ